LSKRLVSGASGERLEGEPVKLNSLIGKELLIEKILELPSSYGAEGAVYYKVQATAEGKKIVFSVDGRSILAHDLKKAMSGPLPIASKIEEKKSEKTGRMYRVFTMLAK